MTLILLVVLFAAIGYLVAGSPIGDKVDEASDKVAATSKGWLGNLSAWWRTRFAHRGQVDGFKSWSVGEGADYLPDDFKEWLVGLSEEEAQAFSQTLSDYAEGLGFNLDKLVDGSIDQQPMLKQVFVETIVVYSNAYRKAKKAQQEADETAKAKPTAPDDDGKKPAEKRARQRGEAVQEATETASAT